MIRSLRERTPSLTLWHAALYECGRALSLAFATFFYRFRSFGSRNVPARGPVLIVANHQSYLDPPLVGSPVRQRQCAFVARGGLFRSRPLAWLLSAVNSIAIRENEPDTAAIREVLRLLEGGHAVVLFPEGTRSPDGSMTPFKRGVAVIVKRARCTIVPAAIEGAFDAWPRNARFPRLIRRRVAVMYGAPIDSERLLAAGPDAALDRLARQIDAQRLDLRRLLRHASRGHFPASGPADEPSFAQETA